MKLTELEEIRVPEPSQKLIYKQGELRSLLNALRNRDIPEELVAALNREIEQINQFSGSGREVLNQLRRVEYGILKLLEKELKLVPKNTYRTRWMAIGMSVFGVPIGVAFGASLGNMAFLAIGIPIGMSIGIAIGTGMDRKAYEEGRQLDIEIRSR